MRKTGRSIYSALAGEVFAGFLGMPENPLSDDACCEEFKNYLSFAGWSSDGANAVLARLRVIENTVPVRTILRGDA